MVGCEWVEAMIKGTNTGGSTEVAGQQMTPCAGTMLARSGICDGGDITKEQAG